jgi:hypothetical protein
VFIIFAIFNACWVPLVYVFFPETKGLELEAIDAIFEKGGITGGVWGARKNGGRTVENTHLMVPDDEKMEAREEKNGKEEE